MSIAASLGGLRHVLTPVLDAAVLRKEARKLDTAAFEAARVT